MPWARPADLRGGTGGSGVRAVAVGRLPDQVPRYDPGPPSAADVHRPPSAADVHRLLADGGPAVVLQPQLSLVRGEVAGYEALARFPSVGGVSAGVEAWFAVAHQHHLGAELEAVAAATALRWRPHLPSGVTLGINFSPSVLSSAAVRAVLPADLSGVEIEVTEHEVVADPDGLRRSLEDLRARGARIAIDDVGAGQSGLRRVLELAPDTLKLDRHVVQGAATDRARAALIRTVVDLGHRFGALVLAEGVETIEDLLALADLDVGLAQGYLVGRPAAHPAAAPPDVVRACDASLRRVLTAALPSSRAPASTEDLLAALADVADLDELAGLTQAVAGVLGCPAVELSYLSADGRSVEAVLADRWRGEGQSFLIADYPATRRCLGERVVVPVHVGDDLQDGMAQEIALLLQDGWGRGLLVPISCRGRVIGLMECFARDGHPWSRRQIRIARLIASVVGPVMGSFQRG